MSKYALDENSYALQYGNIPKLLLKYSIPSVISMLVLALYNIVDRIYVGHGLGAMAISGLAITLPISSMISAIGTLVGFGSAARVSIVLGKKDTEWARNILCHYPFIMGFFSLLFIGISMIFLDELLVLFGATENTISYAYDYLKIVIPASIFTNFCFGFSNILRAAGFPKKAMIAVVLGVLLNMVLDPIFIFVLNLGIEGVAYATAISMFVGAIYSIIHFLNRENTVSFHWESFRLRGYILKNVLSIGFSPFLMNLVASGVGVVINVQLVKYGGDYAIGAFGIIYSYQMFLALFLMGITFGMQPISGYNFGAGNIKRVKEVTFLTMKVTTLCTVPFLIMAELFPSTLARAFTSDETLIAHTTEAFRLSFIFVMSLGVPFTVSIFLLSMSRALKSAIMSLARQLIFLTPLLFTLPIFFGLRGVWYAITLSDLLAFVSATIFFVTELKVLYRKDLIKHINLFKVISPRKSIDIFKK